MTQPDRPSGVLPDTQIEEAVSAGHILPATALHDDQIQPASLDLRLGYRGWRVQASFLPGHGQAVADKLDKFTMHEIDLTGGAVLEKGCVYIVELMEALDLPDSLSAMANPKSSTSGCVYPPHQ